MTDRVKCIECDNMILPQTAADNDGLCGQCVKILPELRAAQREYDRGLTEGLVFIPTDQERSTASLPDELVDAGDKWTPQPEFYAETEIDSAMNAVAAAKSKTDGNVFLVTENGGQLNLGFNKSYGVCEYQNHETGEFRYAFSSSNLRGQVSEELHVVQACPCCGVGLLWYPSRYHMPRHQAFSILENVLANRPSPDIEWLETDDFSYTERGRG